MISDLNGPNLELVIKAMSLSIYSTELSFIKAGFYKIIKITIILSNRT